MRAARFVFAVALLLSSSLLWASDSRSTARSALPDRMSVAWTATVANLDAPLDYKDFTARPQASFSPEVAVLPDLVSIQVRDVRTGRLLHDIPAGERVGDVAVAGDVVVAQVRPASDNNFDYAMLRAYDWKSGRQLWGQYLPTSRLVETARYTFSQTAAVTPRGLVVVQGGQLIGIDLKTGVSRWTSPLPCPKLTVSATVAKAVLACDGGPLILMDPGTGRRRDVQIPGHLTELTTTPDAVSVESSETDVADLDFQPSAPRKLTVVAESGRVLGRFGTSPGGLVQVDGDQVIFAGDGRIRAISLTRGTELWRRKPEKELGYGGHGTEFETGFAASNGLSMFHSVLEEGRPGTTSFTDPSGKSTPPLPWPVSGQFAGAIPGYVFVVSHGAQQYQFTALRLENEGLADPRLGPAKPADWPDPCRLLTPEQLATLGPGYAAFRATPSPFVKSLRLPHSDQCNFAGKHAFSLRIDWVAPDEKDAAALAQSLLADFARARQAGPDGYQYLSLPATSGPIADRAMVVQGRRVIDVFAPKQVALAGKVARLLQTGRKPVPAGELDKAAAEKTVEEHGFDAVIQASPPNPGPLRAVYANCGFQCGQVFLFDGNRLVGAPPGESASRHNYRDVQIIRQDGGTVRLAAAVYPPGPACCPIRRDIIHLRMSGDRLVYRVGSGPWRPAPAAPDHP